MGCNADVLEIITVSNFSGKLNLKGHFITSPTCVAAGPHLLHTYPRRSCPIMFQERDRPLLRASFCFASYWLSLDTQMADESTIAPGQSLTLLPLLSSNTPVRVLLFLFSFSFPRLLVCLLAFSSHFTSSSFPP
jgi:hypothetical protein